jgi:hypothetical protein
MYNIDKQPIKSALTSHFFVKIFTRLIDKQINTMLEVLTCNF